MFDNSRSRMYGRMAAIPSLAALLLGLGLWAAPAASAAASSLTYTFNSPTNPWTAEELSALQTWVSRDYPLIVGVFGQPNGSRTINVVKDYSLPYPGMFGNNTITMGTFEQSVFVHESTHAFRGPAILSNPMWEEGMTRAAEIEVMNLVGDPTFFDLHHQYPYDQFYDLSARKKLAVSRGDIVYLGSPGLVLLRYELASMAWDKLLMETSSFLSAFNAKLYAGAPLDTSGLITLATSVQPTVEGKTFSTWYSQQGLFNESPAAGCFLTQRISQYTADLNCRDANGNETPQVGAKVTWAVYANGGTLASGSSLTSSYGWIDWHPNLGVYTGRVKVKVSTVINGVSYTDTEYRSTVDPEVGPAQVFGVTTTVTSGTVTFSSLDGKFAAFSVPVTNGAFQAPSLGTLRGRIKAVYTGGGITATRLINKDATSFGIRFYV